VIKEENLMNYSMLFSFCTSVVQPSCK